MLDNTFSRNLFHLTSVLTAWFPRAGAWLLDLAFIPLIGNRPLARFIFNRNLRIAKSVKEYKKILVVSDIHIGDAILASGSVSAFRNFFPNAQIDYVVKKSVACFFEGHPEITKLYPIFTGGQYPNESDLESVRKLTLENHYDLCMNCCPFLGDQHIFPKGQKVMNMMTAAPEILWNLRAKTGTCHFMYQSYGLPYKILSKITDANNPGTYKGGTIVLSKRATEEAKSFLENSKIPHGIPVFFLNPDAASPYNRVPFENQLELLKGLLKLKGHVILGSGFTAKGIEKQLLEKLGNVEKNGITIVPNTMSLDGYAALIDSTDYFISADTGPLHIAAARKLPAPGNTPFRNRTFVIAIFGATNARMSGYDSTDPLFPAANQDAPSRTYVSESPCRNITCMNKMAKTCEKVRCFEFLDTGKIFSDIQSHLGQMS